MRIYASVRKGRKERCDDRVLVGNVVLEDGYYEARIEDSGLVLAVADGVGGKPGGYMAATMTLEAMAGLQEEHTFTEEAVIARLKSANDMIQARSLQDIRFSKMASTLSLLAIRKESATAFQLGDSRIYRLVREPGSSSLQQMTTDQNRLAEWMDTEEFRKGRFSVETLKGDPTWCYITSYMGMSTQLLTKRLQCVEGIPGNGTFVLTSDGIHDYIDADEFKEWLLSELPAEEKILQIMDRARENGSRDDQSMIIAEPDDVGGRLGE